MTKNNERATLAGGFFGGTQELNCHMPAVLATRVGCTVVDVNNARYRNYGYHAETIEILFDSEVTDFRTLL